MKEPHYNMYMKNVETLETTMRHYCAASSTTTKRNLKVDLGKCVQMYRAPNSLNAPLSLLLQKSQTYGAGYVMKTSRVTRVTLVLWIGNETLRSLPLWERLRVTESWTHIESRQFIGWWHDAFSNAMTSSGHTGERAIHSSDFSAEKNPVGSVRSLAANAVSRSLFREQGLRE